MAGKKIKMMEHACPDCGKSHKNGGGLVADVGEKTVTDTATKIAKDTLLLRCANCGWIGTKAETTTTEKVSSDAEDDLGVSK
jgi:predicted RNA-binding Zn-ribbon protein involved in translation (DUF1610 family)